MDLAPASSAAEELDRLERELAAGLERIADLNKRARVLEIETGNWVRPAPRGGFRVSLVAVGVAGFWLGTFGTRLVLGLFAEFLQ